MDVELLHQIGWRLLTLDGGQCHLRLEGRCVVPARSSAHHLSCPTAILAFVRQKPHLSDRPDSPGHLSPNSYATAINDAGLIVGTAQLGLIVGWMVDDRLPRMYVGQM